MLNITYCQRNANEDLILIRTAASKKERKEQLFSGDAKWCNHYGKQYGSSSKN